MLSSQLPPCPRHHLVFSSPVFASLSDPLPGDRDVVVRGRDRPGGHGLPGGVLLLPVPGAAGHRLPPRPAAQEGGREDQEDHPAEVAQEKASASGGVCWLLPGLCCRIQAGGPG